MDLTNYTDFFNHFDYELHKYYGFEIAVEH